LTRYGSAEPGPTRIGKVWTPDLQRITP
jgi:hypothetical protein